MLGETPLLLQAPVPVPVHVTGAAVLLLFTVLLGLGRWRLPAGVAEMLFATGLSGLLLLNTELAGDATAAVPLAAALSGIALLWAVVHRWVERPRSAAGKAATSSLRRPAAVLAFALAALGTLVVLPRENPVITAPATLVVLAVAAAVIYISTRSTLARDAALAMVVLGSWHVATGLVPVVDAHLAGGALLLSALVALVLVIGAVLVNWRLRIRIWQTDPQQLADPQPAQRVLHGLALILGVGVGWGSLVTPGVWVTPLAVFCAALAVLGVGHLRSSAAIGRLGLALVAEALVLCAVTWLPATPARTMLGLAIAGVYLLWLARFWTQQLHGGRAWTTAGRLIPAARDLSYAAAGLACVAAFVWRVDDLAWEHRGYAQTIGAGAALLVLMSMLFRDAVAQQSPAAATAGWLALLGAMVAAQAVLRQFDLQLPTAAALGAASLLGALRSRIGYQAAGPHWPHNAWIGALLPVTALCTLLLTGTLRSPHGLLALAGLLAALLVRFTARRSSWSTPPQTG